jgi:hydrogenase maturation protease
MSPLLIACGNPLRRDDGVAAKAAEFLAQTAPEARIRVVHQLTPELAAELTGCSPVVFLDAGVVSRKVAIELLPPAASRAALSHYGHPAAIVSLARDLFDFRGEAFICRIPAADFRAGLSLSARGRQEAARAAAAVKALLRRSSKG